MNKAQKRTWYRLAASILGLLFMSSAFAVIKIKNLDFTDKQDCLLYVSLGLLNTTPLIWIALLDWRWKKVYDERDVHIEERSQAIGSTVAFVLLGIGMLIYYLTIGPLNSIAIKGLDLPVFFCLVFYFFLITTNAATLVLYRLGRE